MPRDVMPVDADGAILLRAADLIEQGGWWNGAEEEFEAGRHCVVMAISAVHGAGANLEVIDRFALRLGVKSMAGWNDIQPNAEAVTSHMRAAAYVPVSA